MKKKHTKALKLLANKLPPSVEITKGLKFDKEFTESTEIKGIVKEVDMVQYSKTSKAIPINHYNRLKSAYRRKGTQGIMEYIEWVDKHNIKMNSLIEWSEGMKEFNRVDKKIMRIAKSGVNRFWQSLLIFLYSFVEVFVKKEELNEV